jgi:acyl transferase domain-containing protein/acyl carrier protein
VTVSAARLALAVRRARAQAGPPDLLNSDPIAVIGMGCRLPGGADSPNAYWTLLRDGVDAIRDLPSARRPLATGTTAHHGGFLESVDRFDAEFFGIPPREAERLDPQHRLLMEVIWESLWDARLAPEKTAGASHGVFVAIYNNDYFRLQFSNTADINAYTSTGTSHSTAVGRISFLLDWKGPSIAIDTACSSSLVAIHMACRSLRTNECDMAVAGGVSLILGTEHLTSLQRLGMLASDSRCKTFDSRADGFVPGEGCGIVVLKRLSDALADGDPIRAIIRGTAVNQDGRSTVLTAPNGLSQRAVIRAALENAHVEGSEIQFVEAHGTGTALGDPVEVEALAEVIGTGSESCVLGSVKSNFGHLEAAAGVTGLMKVILALEQEQIPRNLHFRQLNPHIQLEGTRLVVADRTMPWLRGRAPRFAGVSSFGFGGTNAHLVLEEVPAYPGPTRPVVAPHVWQRQRHWFEPTAPREAACPGHPMLGRQLDSPVLRETVFESELGAQAPSFLADHRPGGKAILPLAACLEMFLAASGASALEDVIVQEPLELPAFGTRKVQIVVDGDELRLFSQDQAKWKLYATARRSAGSLPYSSAIVPDSLRAAGEKRNVEQFYKGLEERGLIFGPTFRCVENLWVGEKRVAALVRLQVRAEGYRIAPTLLDGCFQPLGALLPKDGFYLPLGLRRFQLFRTPESSSLWSEAAIRIADGNVISGEVKIYEPSGQLVATAEGLWLRKPVGGTKECLSEIAWVPRPLETAEGCSLDGQWLVFADESGVGESIVAALKAEGANCLVVKRGEDFENLLNGAPPSGVVHLWNLDGTAPGDRDEESLLREQRENCGSVLRLIQVLAEKHGAERPRVWLVTRGAQLAAANQKECFAANASVWGLARTIRREHPDLRCISVDLDPEFPRADHVIEEIRHGAGVDQVAWRGEGRLVPQLVDRADEPENARLESVVKGRLEELRWQTSVRSKPARGEVEIRVAAAGLNFRDVLNALGEYPGDAGLLGSECSGWIEQVGEGVAGLAVGDEVVGVARGSFARFVTTRADLVAHKPKELGMEDAAALSVAYITARYALETIGNMRAGQRVLIHAAAGGVGLAAVAEAQRVGAEVFATVGSDEKREWLKSLGVQHIMNSRGLDYRREIAEQTAGHGVDLVLNSLVGEHISESLQALAPGGVFLELGKRGVWDAARVKGLRPDVRYFVVDWGEEYERNPAVVAAVFRDLMQDVESGALKPLPCRIFAKADAEKAFRWMAQGRHIGKIVVQMPAGTRMRADGTYLITGGAGALGLKIAGWMAAHGAGKLILVGRSAPNEDARSAIRTLEAAGTEVEFRAADVSRRAELEAIFQEIKKGSKPLRGVVHAAGVVDDAVLSQQNWDRFAKVMRPKILGALRLHTLTANVELDFFIMFSSLASLFGSPGQGNYAAANAFLDALAVHRRTLGLPGLSINWGPWEGSGMAAEATGWQRSFPSLNALSANKGLELWQRILELGNISQIAAFERQAHTPEISFAGGEFARALAADSGGTGRSSGVSGAHGKKLVEHLREEAAKIIGLRDANDLDVDAPLFEAGLDSLMAVEFRNVLGAAFGRSFSSTLLFDYPSVQKLATFLERAAQPASAHVGAVDIENLDESAAEAMLIAELGMGTKGIKK